MSEWIVYSKDGLTERCRLKRLEYNGSFMNERTISATFEYHSEVAFDVFDYIVYRNEKFELESIPSVKKISNHNYEYELRFVSLKYELERCEMRDIVPKDNGVTYPTPLTFSFTGDVRYLTERIQANLDSLYGEGVWSIVIPEGVKSEEKNITISQQNCWNALSLVNTTYNLTFSIKGRVITVGGEQSLVGHVFQYGKGKGLYEIERVSDTDTGIVTKVRAYGGTRNLDYSYPKRPEWTDSVLPVSFALSPLRLMLPSFKLDGKTDYVLADDSIISEYGIREASVVYDDIYPSITGMLNYDDEPIDEIKSVDEVDDSKDTFIVYLYDLGFDLESNLTTENAQISMKSGSLIGYTFNISEIEKQEDNSYKITLGRITNEEGDTGNFNIPNSQWSIAAGDKFVLLNILMPQEYIRHAEERLLERAKEYLNEYGRTNFSYNVGLHDKFLKENANIYEELIEGSKLRIYDQNLGISEDVTIQSITITENMGDNMLTQVKVTLNNKPSASTIERIQGQIKELSETSAGQFSTQSELLKQYRRKLDKPFFDRLFAAVDINGNEIPSTDLSTPIAYIKARYSVASIGGFTMYLNDNSYDLPSIYDGLPIDNNTIYWENGILKAKGGGGIAESVSWADITGKPEWLLDGKISYSEIEGTPDLSVYALKRSLSEYVTKTELTNLDYADKDWVKEYVVDINTGNITAITKQMVIEALGYTPYNSTNPAGYITSTALNGYATQDWVTKRGYLTSIPSEYITETELAAKGYATALSVNTALGNKVDKIDGKGLSTEDFTTALKTKLESLNNYNDTAISNAVTKLRNDFDALVEGDTSTAIDNFNEIIAFLNGVQDNQDLSSIIASIEQQIAAKYTKPSGGIPKSDLVQAVQTSLGKADSALQSHQSIYTLTFQSGTFASGSFTANSGNKTINIPTTTSHISEGGNLYFTNARAVSALADTLKSYVTLSGSQTVSGEKNFTGGLKVNGSPIVYDAAKKYWKLEGDLLITGGLTMYGSDSSFTPSTIMDAIAVDGTTISKEGGVLRVIGGGSGSISEITKQMVIDALGFTPISSSDVPTALPNPHSLKFGSKLYDGSASKTILASDLGITWDDILGRPTLLSSFTDDVVAGKYLPLTGGTISGFFAINGSNASYTQYKVKNAVKGEVGWHSNYGIFIKNETSKKFLNITDEGLAQFDGKTIIHSGNIGSQSVSYATSAGNAGSLVYNSSLGVNDSVSTGTISYARLQREDVGVLPFASNANGVLTLNTHGGDYHHQLGFTGYGLFYRNTHGVPLSDSIAWKQIAFTDSNVASATYATSALQMKTVLAALGTVDLNSVTNGGDIFNYNDTNRWVNGPSGMSYGRVRVLTGTISTGELTGQLAWDINHNSTTDTTRGLWWRAIQNADRVSYAKWHQIAFTDSNVASATKLKTARTIWGQSFDGTGNVSGHLSLPKYASIKVTDYNEKELAVLELNGEGNLLIGQYTTKEGYDTVIYGNTIKLAYGNYGTSTYSALVVNPQGNVTIGAGDLASTNYRLYVNGKSIYRHAILADRYNGQGNIAGASIVINKSGDYFGIGPSDSNKEFLSFGTTSNYSGDWKSEFMTIARGGNVLIGTTTNSGYKLDVNGTLNATTIYQNGVTLNSLLDAKLNSSRYTASDVLAKLKTVDGSGSGLDADMLDGYNETSFLIAVTKETSNINSTFGYTTNRPFIARLSDSSQTNYPNPTGDSGYGNLVHFGVPTKDTAFQLYSAYSTYRLLYRMGTWYSDGSGSIHNKAWKEVAFTDSNVASATKLQTPRTIWGQSFDGTGDVSGSLVLSRTNPIVVTDTESNTLTAFQLNNDNSLLIGQDIAKKGYETIIYGNQISFAYGNRGSVSNTALYISPSGNVGIGTTNPSAKLDVHGQIAINGLPTVYSNGVSTFYAGNIAVTSYFGGNNVHLLYGASETTGLILNSEGNVGIGTTSPSAKLEVNGNVAFGGVATFNDVISINRNGSSGAILNTSKSALKIECYSTYTSFNTYTGGGASTPNVFVLRDNGNIGIGTTSPSQKLHVDGNILTTGGVTMYSMRKLKNIVDERGLSLEELRTIKPTRYTWNDGRDNRIHFGGIADDIQQVLPEVVYRTNDGVLTMDYGNAAFAIASSLIQPVIRHENEITSLKRKVRELEEEVKRLKSA